MKNRFGWIVLILIAVLALPSRRCAAQGLGFTQDFAAVGPSGFGTYSLAVHDDGTGSQLYVGGEFTQLFGSPYYYSQNIVRWNGSAWSSVGWGFDGASWPRGVFALAVYDDGNGPQLYAGGRFNWMGSAATGWIQGSTFARWDGQRWWPLYPYVSNGAINAMVVFDDGSGPQLYTGILPGGVARWNGQTWTSVGTLYHSTLPGSTSVTDLCVHDDGSGPALYAAGYFDVVEGQPANGLARWDGHQLTPVAGTPAFGGSPGAMASFDDGGGPGLIYCYGGMWRWRGGTWSNVGPYNVYSLIVHDDGNGPALFAASPTLHPPGTPPGETVHMARWDGVEWTAVGGVDTTWNPGGQQPNAMATYDFGEGEDLYIGGYIWELGGQLTHNMARFRGAHGLISRVCGGDGSLVKCPCNPRGAVGRGCPNSADPAGALLRASGVTSDDSIALHVGALPASTMALLFQGSTYDYASSFLGDGVLCTAGSVLRLFVKQAQNGAVLVPEPSDPSLRARANALGDPLTLGSVRYYQVWYRDADPQFCPSGGLYNVTNGLRVVW